MKGKTKTSTHYRRRGIWYYSTLADPPVLSELLIEESEEAVQSSGQQGDDVTSVSQGQAEI